MDHNSSSVDEDEDYYDLYSNILKQSDKQGVKVIESNTKTSLTSVHERDVSNNMKKDEILKNINGIEYDSSDEDNNNIHMSDFELKIQEDIKLYKDNGTTFIENIKRKKEYQNPQLLNSTVRYFDIDENGSNFNKSIFDPEKIKNDTSFLPYI